MEKKPSIVHRMINGERSQIFHSSAYARAQSGTAMGAASTESFAQRQALEQNRQNVRKYGDSLVAGQRFNTLNRQEAAQQSGNVASAGGVGGEGNAGGVGLGARPREAAADAYGTAEARAKMSARFANPAERPGAGAALQRRQEAPYKPNHSAGMPRRSSERGASAKGSL